MATIDHVFVLMLENRSFDHFFGLCGRGDIPRPADPGFKPGASDRAASDPPHEFADVQAQIAGGTMGGFDASAKLAFDPTQIPVINQLAQEFVLFDNWHSSLPGPTWPNRFFVHAASSGGLATSPTAFQTAGAVISPRSPFQFQNGSIFDRLDSLGKKWRIYHGDVHPQVLAMPGLCRRYLSAGDEFRPIYPQADSGLSDFATDVSAADYEPVYTFIEPDYAVQLFSQFVNGDSQHPKGSVSSGEALIKYVYEALRNSPVWSSSALLITWDEHGGFYDQMPPPTAIPPGDEPLNAPQGGPSFAFDRYGMRVPAILASPFAPRGALGSSLFPGATFDHSSVIASVFEIFGLGAPLTQRDAHAPSWDGCLAAGARNDLGPARLSGPAASVAHLAVTPSKTGGETDGFLAGVALISLDMDRIISEQTGASPIASFTPQTRSQYAQARTAALADPHFKSRLVQYINEVGVRVTAHRLRARTERH
jgi:phospholipase C